MKLFEYNLIFVLSAISVKGQQFMNQFIDEKTTNIVLCNPTDNIGSLEDVTNISEQSHLWIEYWDCIDQPIPKTYNSLIILSDIEPNDMRMMFAKENIQRSLSTNTWVLYVDDNRKQFSQYFDNLKLSLGLNFRLFVVKRSRVVFEVTQVLGTGTNQVIYKVRLFDYV